MTSREIVKFLATFFFAAVFFFIFMILFNTLIGSTKPTIKVSERDKTQQLCKAPFYTPVFK